MRVVFRALVVVAALAMVWPTSPGSAQTAQGGEPARRVVVLGADYEASGLKSFIFGSDYRDLWTEPIELPVLDLSREAGGLTPQFRVGRNQTAGLALRGADGKSYTFRGINKDPTTLLPEELLGTPIADLAQDQISSNFPASEVVAAVIGEAAGLLVVQPRMVVMPDSPALGEFREDFAGLVGTIAEFPTVGAFDSEEIIDGPEMIEHLTASSEHRIDARAFARARLVDQLLGDWDRHVEQWRWARVRGEEGWQPIPEDRDQAFSRYDGIAMFMQRDKDAKFDRFGARYQALEGLTWNGRSVDRRLLSELSREDWLAIARDLRERLTDQVIDQALRTMPDEFYALRGTELREGLIARRDALVGQADRFHAYLAGEVDVRATNAADRIVVRRLDDGGVEVALAAADRAGEPYFERRFSPDRTEDVRVYTGDGDDVVTVAGGRRGGIEVRLVCGAGTGRVDVESAGVSYPCDLGSRGALGGGPEIAPNVRLSPAEPLEETGTPYQTQGAALQSRRDWGGTRYGQPWFEIGPDIGVFGGFGLTFETFSFRKRPFSTQHRVRLGFSTGAARPRADYLGVFRRENRRHHYRVHAFASGIETLNFFGVGNETPEQEDTGFRRAKRTAIEIDMRSVWALNGNTTVHTGPVARYSTTHENDDDLRLVNVLAPYGVADIAQVGWGFGLRFNDRRRPEPIEPKESDDILRFDEAPVGRGYTLDASARYYPEILDLEDAYWVVRGDATASYWLGDAGPGIAFRAGGVSTSGEVPYYDLAFLGSQQVRGLVRNRFAGDRSAYGNVMVAMPVGKLSLVIPGRWGVFARADTGRVWVEEEDSDTWHWGLGGGVWWTPWNTTNAIRIHVADSDEGMAGYLIVGFGF